MHIECVRIIWQHVLKQHSFDFGKNKKKVKWKHAIESIEFRIRHVMVCELFPHKLFRGFELFFFISMFTVKMDLASELVWHLDAIHID